MAGNTTLRRLSFEADGRTFTCEVGPLHNRSEDAWWWFRVSSEEHQRFAPFRAAPEDTSDDVRARILSYYEDLLARRAAPAPTRWQRRAPVPGAGSGSS